jgi:hypothetical protein
MKFLEGSTRLENLGAKSSSKADGESLLRRKLTLVFTVVEVIGGVLTDSRPGARRQSVSAT